MGAGDVGVRGMSRVLDCGHVPEGRPAATVDSEGGGRRTFAARRVRDSGARGQARACRAAVARRRRDRPADRLVEQFHPAGRDAPDDGDDRRSDLRRPPLLGTAERPRPARDRRGVCRRLQRAGDRRQARARASRLLRGEPDEGSRLDVRDQRLVHGRVRRPFHLRALCRRVPGPVPLLPQEGGAPFPGRSIRDTRERPQRRHRVVVLTVLLIASGGAILLVVFPLIAGSSTSASSSRRACRS